MGQRLDFKNNVDYHWRTNRQTLHSVDQSNLACLSIFSVKICTLTPFACPLGRLDHVAGVVQPDAIATCVLDHDRARGLVRLAASPIALELEQYL